MIEWSEQHLMIRDMVRRFVEAEIKPQLEELEHGDTPPYDVLRKMMQTFGIDEMARMRFEQQIARERGGARARRAPPTATRERAARRATSAHAAHPDHRALPLLPGHGDGARRERRASPPRPILSQGHDRAEGALGAAAPHAREDRRLGDHRAGLGLRRVRRR